MKNGPIELATDGTTIFYFASNASGAEIDKWTPGDASSTTITSTSAINDCYSGLVRSAGLLFASCNGQIYQVPDTGPVTLYAGEFAGGTNCIDSADKAGAFFYDGANSPQLDVDGNVLVTSCNAIRQIAPADGGVTTFAGQLNTPGYVDGPRASARFGKDAQSIMPFLRLSSSQFFVADGENAVIRGYDQAHDSIVTLAGTSPAVHATDARGNGADSRYTNVTAMVSDGTNLYALGHAAGSSGTPRTLVAIDLTSGASTDLHTFAADARAIARISNQLYVALADGSIHSIATSGTSDTVVAGIGSNAKYPPSDGTPGNAQSAVMDPIALSTDGTDLYFVDAAKLLRKLDLPASAVSPIAGTQDTLDIIDAGAGSAHFANPGGLVYLEGNLYVIDGLVAGVPTVIRRIALSTGQVDTIAGQTNTIGDADGVGPAGQIGGAQFLTTDGTSLFISDAADANLSSTQLSPTIRQLELKSLSLTTMLGQRGLWTILNGTGANALIHAPGPITFDSTTHSLYFFDRQEGVFQKIR